MANNPINFVDPDGRIAIGSIWGPNGLGRNPAAIPGQGGIQLSPPSQEFLKSLSTASGVAATASFFYPGGQAGVPVFIGIGLTSTLLESYLYSDNPAYDALKESIKMSLPVNKPYDFLTDPLIDMGAEKLKQELQDCGK